MALNEITVGEIADLLKGVADSERKACLLIGAGVSYSAGIGLTGDFVKRIAQEYPVIYNKACNNCNDGKAPSYAQCMAALPPAKQVELVRKDIDAAKINWAHVGIARMERGQIVDTILTPNFDPLASRACALFNRFPAIYDLAGLRDAPDKRINFERSYVKGSAIFHLHGQHSGFLLLNTQAKLEDQAKRIRPVLDSVMKGKPVIIAGYSGENDPLIDEIAALAPFNHGLYWVCHDGNDPAANVCEKLLALEDCHLVRNMPADKFFTDIANALKLDPPGFLATPFDHLHSVFDTLRPYSDVGDGMGADLLALARDQLDRAKKEQQRAQPNQAEIATLMSDGDFDAVWERFGTNPAHLDEESKDMVAWAAVMLGNSISNQAITRPELASDEIFASAYDYYAAALSMKPNMYQAMGNWGAALLDQADTKDEVEAANLVACAETKLNHAEELKPGYAAYNLACVYGRRGDAHKAREWLLLSKQKNILFPGCAHIIAESNFDPVRDTPEFKAALADIGC